MAAQPDISSILAALAAQTQQRASGTPAQAISTPQPGLTQPFPGVLPPPPAPGGFALPQPTSSGSLDLSAIKPVSTGSVSIADAIAKARGIAAEKGLSYDGGRSSAASVREDPRLAGRSSYRRSRSRSRSPSRRDNFRDNYNPYRDERRDDRRGGNGYGRDRSISPAPRARGNLSPRTGRNYTRDRSPVGDNENVEVIMIDSALVGLIIGRQGDNLRRVESETGTRVQFITGPDNSGPQRQCKITGTPRQRADAKREIYRIIDENSGGQGKSTAQADRGAQRPPAQVRPGQENSVQIMVPDRTVGLIIGRGGETIRDLQERSGCHVNIVGENKSVNGLRPVNLIGSPQAATRAKELIMEIVDSDTKNSAQSSQSRDSRGGNDVHAPLPENLGANAGKINDKIMVPSEAVGMIIGKGGETIKEMQNQTGCKINVSQASGADIEREIGLVGTRTAIEDAKRAIWEKVDTVREKNSGHSGNRRGGSGGRDNFDQYGDRYSQNQPMYGGQQQGATQPMVNQQGNQGAPGGNETNSAAGATDPYAAYGGYQNYIAMWYAAMAQQQQQQGAPGDQQKPAGSA